MTTRASANGTGEIGTEFEAAHYSTPEMEEEWEMEVSHYSNPYSNPYSTPEMEEEWEVHEGHPYSNPEFEEEWETPEGHPYSNPEMEWEMHEGHPYSNPEMEDEADRFIPIIAKAATRLLPKAIRVGRNLIRGMRQRPGSRRRAGGTGGRNQQIAGLFHQLGRIFAQGEYEAATHEAQLFGANEFETEVTANEIAHQAALSEVMAAEAAHTESVSEAQALMGATLPISMRVMGGTIGIRRQTPTLLRVNAQLVLKLRRQGVAGRQLTRILPSVQRRTIASLKRIEQTGQPITPAIASKVMTGQAARVLTSPHICRRALTRNMVVRQQTVAPPRVTSRSSMRVPGGRGVYRPGVVRPTRPTYRRPMSGTARPAPRPFMRGPARPTYRRPIGGTARPAGPRSGVTGRPVPRARQHVRH